MQQEAKQRFATLIHADPDEIAFVQSTTDGENIVFGDSGEIFAAGTDAPQFGSQPITLGLLTTTAPQLGGNDLITTGQDDDIVLGGFLNDTIAVGDGHNIVLGDNGSIDYSAADGNPADIDEIVSAAPNYGGSDTIT